MLPRLWITPILLLFLLCYVSDLMGEVGFSIPVEGAMAAFSSDVSYAVAIVSAAVGIRKKRQIWQLKADTRQAEADARSLCEQAEPFVCMNQSPCGVGSCKFSTGEFTLLKVSRCKGDTPRPQRFVTGGSYSIDSVIVSLGELRASIVK